jgi:hypothetical protein
MAVVAEQFLLARQLIAGSFSPRKHFDSEALHKLAETIKLHGLIPHSRPAAIGRSVSDHRR